MAFETDLISENHAEKHSWSGEHRLWS